MDIKKERETICEICSKHAWCFKLEDKLVEVCPLFINYKLFGTFSSPDGIPDKKQKNTED